MGRTKSGILKYPIVLLVLLLCIGTAHAANILVGENMGNDTIAAAITNATDGDIITVSDGTYIENIVVNKEVTIRAENGSASTVVQAASPDHVFNITANNVTIHGFNITGASEYSGIYVQSVSNCNISENHLVNNSFGIYTSSSTDSTLTNNTLNSNEYGIFLYDSTDNTLIDNIMTSNDYNFGVYGTSMEHFIHDINPGNLVNEKSLYYLIDQANMQVSSDAGQVYVVNSTNVTVKDITVSSCLDGVTFAYTNNSKIENVTASECEYGFYLFKSDLNILNNISSNNNDYGIIIDESNNNTLSDSIVNSSTFEGIYLYTSSYYNTVTNNIVSNNEWDGIALYSSSEHNIISNNTINSNGCDGIYLDHSGNNTLEDNVITDNPESGIDLYNSHDNAISSNIVSNNTHHGIYLNSSSYNTLTNNTASDNLDKGVYIYNSSNFNALTDNTATRSDTGIKLYNSDNSILTNNTATSNDHGIYLEYSTNNTLMNNTMGSNDYNFGVYGPGLEHFIHNIDNTNNLINGKPLYYLVSQADEEIPPGVGQVYVVNSTNITVREIEVSNAFAGAVFAYTDNSIIENFSASECESGVYLFNSSFNVLDNIIANTNDYGIFISASNNNTLSDSITNSNSGYGISLSGSSNYNTLNSNTATGNLVGIVLINSADRNTLENNTANSNLIGIGLLGSDNNDVTYNTANDNLIGIDHESSANNSLVSNIANSNYIAGIGFYESSDNELIDNTANSNSLAGIILQESSDNVLGNNIVKDSTGDSGFGVGSMDSGSLSNTPFNEYNIINKFNSNFVSSSANMINSIYSDDIPPVSYGVHIVDCYNNTLSGTYSTGNYYAFYALRSLNTTVNNLILTEDLAQMSFVTDYGKTYLRGYDSNSVSLSGKTNVNGYVDFIRSPDYLSSIALESIDYLGTEIKFHYENPGMSNEDESSIALFRLNGNEWVEVPNATLNTSGNYVSATINENDGVAPVGIMEESPTYTVTLALFIDGETPRSNSGSAVQRERREGTITDLPLGNDGEITGDSVVKSSDTSTTLTFYKGTKALDPFGNPVSSIIITTPSSLPADTPGEVIESGLYFRFGPSGTTFSQEVMITMDFDPELFEGRAPVIYTYTSEEGWIALETTVDWENGRATAMISHFSLYALFGTDSEETQDIVAETQGAVAETFTESAEEKTVEDKGGFGYLYWIIGIVIILALVIVIVKKTER
ncbi:NosD domain-containing protein [Methanolobus sp.]|uniref:right-handed parallel beta-helix repeat-containing protein n=1 Tax=Methanolobus sp. TaxID=1874737 RepID=UPI0025F45BF6|nr:NosD domain-containing protein [Methanolobus sp.]